MKTFSCFSTYNFYTYFTFAISETTNLYVYHTDIKSRNNVPDDSFIILLKVIYSKINLFYPQYNL